VLNGCVVLDYTRLKLKKEVNRWNEGYIERNDGLIIWRDENGYWYEQKDSNKKVSIESEEVIDYLRGVFRP